MAEYCRDISGTWVNLVGLSAGTWPWCRLCPAGPTGSSSQRCPQMMAGRTICAGGWQMYVCLYLQKIMHFRGNNTLCVSQKALSFPLIFFFLAKGQRFSPECDHCGWGSDVQRWPTDYIWPDQGGKPYCRIKMFYYFKNSTTLNVSQNIHRNPPPLTMTYTMGHVVNINTLHCIQWTQIFKTNKAPQNKEDQSKFILLSMDRLRVTNHANPHTVLPFPS